MPAHHLHDTWFKRIRELLPHERVTRVRNVAWMVVGRLLITSLSEASLALKAYSRRMWIEEMFGDWKRHGVCLEQTHLRGSAHLSRLVFLVALLYLWLVAFGVRAIKAGQRPLVDRKDRRDLSIFRIGLYLLDRYIIRNRYPAIRLIPYFETVR